MMNELVQIEGWVVDEGVEEDVKLVLDRLRRLHAEVVFFFLAESTSFSSGFSLPSSDPPEKHYLQVQAYKNVVHQGACMRLFNTL